MDDAPTTRRLSERAARAPAVVAHRGFAGVAPENTLAALSAVADGSAPADAVEVDVVPCADGTPVAFHDERLDAERDGRPLTGGSGYVWEAPLKRLRSLSVLGTGEHVPTLAAAVEALPADVGLAVELKNPGGTDVRPGEALTAAEVPGRRDRWVPFVERVVEVLADANNDLLCSSFCEGAIAAVRELAPGLPTAPIHDDAKVGLAVAERHGCEAIHPRADLVGSPTEETARGDAEGAAGGIVAAARDLGCAVNAWTVRTWREAARLRAAGVDGLIADYPGLLAWTDAR